MYQRKSNVFSVGERGVKIFVNPEISASSEGSFLHAIEYGGTGIVVVHMCGCLYERQVRMAP